MAVKVTTVRAILDSLNGAGQPAPWIEDPGYYSIDGALLEQNQVKPSGASVAMKMFFNVKTGETKFYVAKWVDDTANKLLP